MFLKNIITGENGEYSVMQGGVYNPETGQLDYSNSQWVVMNDSEIEEYKLQSTKIELISARKNFLKNSALEHMPDFPQEILDKRKLAQQEIELINSATSIAQLFTLSTFN